jgi:hypothetical protein
MTDILLDNLSCDFWNGIEEVFTIDIPSIYTPHYRFALATIVLYFNSLPQLTRYISYYKWEWWNCFSTKVVSPNANIQAEK